ncbi:MAG: hypothetical protein ACYDBQ_12035, partial [Thermoplasmatota archaeon]
MQGPPLAVAAFLVLAAGCSHPAASLAGATIESISQPRANVTLVFWSVTGSQNVTSWVAYGIDASHLDHHGLPQVGPGRHWAALVGLPAGAYLAVVVRDGARLAPGIPLPARPYGSTALPAETQSPLPAPYAASSTGRPATPSPRQAAPSSTAVPTSSAPSGEAVAVDSNATASCPPASTPLPTFSPTRRGAPAVGASFVGTDGILFPGTVQYQVDGDPGNLTTWIEYGDTSAFGANGTAKPQAPGTVEDLPNLDPDRTYFLRVHAHNQLGFAVGPCFSGRTPQRVNVEILGNNGTRSCWMDSASVKADDPVSCFVVNGDGQEHTLALG